PGRGSGPTSRRRIVSGEQDYVPQYIPARGVLAGTRGGAKKRRIRNYPPDIRRGRPCPLPARVLQAATRLLPRRARLSIPVVGYQLPCDPPTWVMPMQWRGQYHALIVRSAAYSTLQAPPKTCRNSQNSEAS